ncbi:MAG: class I SAM-dependent methyltransferase [Alphaproteobacteria bacterium]
MTPDQWFVDRLYKLNQLVAACGEPVEGNLFYEHHDASFPHAKLSDRFEKKRQNLLACCRGRTHLLEIGINAGHSALWVLHNNPEIVYHGIDLFKHRYTSPAIQFLKDTFGERVRYHSGNSMMILPQLRAYNPQLCYDVIHIDGGHSLDCCKADTYNALSLAAPNAWILIDDTDLPQIREISEILVHDGILTSHKPEGWQDGSLQAVGTPGRNQKK